MSKVRRDVIFPVITGLIFVAIMLAEPTVLGEVKFSDDLPIECLFELGVVLKMPALRDGFSPCLVPQFLRDRYSVRHYVHPRAH